MVVVVERSGIDAAEDNEYTLAVVRVCLGVKVARSGVHATREFVATGRYDVGTRVIVERAADRATKHLRRSTVALHVHVEARVVVCIH